MDFNDFLNEKNFQVVTSGHSIKYRLSYQYGKGGFLALASSSKENDKELEIDDVFKIGKAIEIVSMMNLKNVNNYLQ